MLCTMDIKCCRKSDAEIWIVCGECLSDNFSKFTQQLIKTFIEKMRENEQQKKMKMKKMKTTRKQE